MVLYIIFKVSSCNKKINFANSSVFLLTIITTTQCLLQVIWVDIELSILSSSFKTRYFDFYMTMAHISMAILDVGLKVVVMPW
jgi:hypothetical protein